MASLLIRSQPLNILWPSAVTGTSNSIRLPVLPAAYQVKVTATLPSCPPYGPQALLAADWGRPARLTAALLGRGGGVQEGCIQSCIGPQPIG